ncbi:hypothetical protein [Brevundimonas sp.]|uniref:hypothetical protein n=1 Tax=Brevundimonas sp. TaxID=1871086 RepID=UPI002898A0A6|nr:hypothetical protein [Brevundimonas sp.]
MSAPVNPISDSALVPAFVGHLLISPSTYRPMLKQAIIDAAVANHISIDGFGYHPGKSVINFVQTSADLKKRELGHQLTIIHLPPESAPLDLTLALATDLLSSLSELPQDARFIDLSSMKEDEKLEIFPGLVVPLPAQPKVETITPLGSALSLFRYGAVRPGMSAEWPVEAFNIDAVSAVTGVSGVFSLPGRARCLMWGPYIKLPAGTWRINIRFTADDAAAQQYFRFEWGGTDLSELSFKPGTSGSYEAELTQSWTSPETVELRFIMPSSALNGYVEIQSIRVEMIGGVESTTLEPHMPSQLPSA